MEAEWRRTWLGYFEASLRHELMAFLNSMGVDASEAQPIIEGCRDVSENDKAPLRMLNSTARLFTLADCVGKACPHGRHARNFLMLLCIDHISGLRAASLGKPDSNCKKALEQLLRVYVPSADLDLLCDRIRIGSDPGPPDFPATIEQLTDILYEMRNSFAHEGSDPGLPFSADGMNYVTPWEVHNREAKVLRTYHLNVTLSFDDFRMALFRGCLSMVKTALQEPGNMTE